MGPKDEEVVYGIHGGRTKAFWQLYVDRGNLNIHGTIQHPCWIMSPINKLTGDGIDDVSVERLYPHLPSFIDRCGILGEIAYKKQFDPPRAVSSSTAFNQEPFDVSTIYAEDLILQLWDQLQQAQQARQRRIPPPQAAVEIHAPEDAPELYLDQGHVDRAGTSPATASAALARTAAATRGFTKRMEHRRLLSSTPALQNTGCCSTTVAAHHDVAARLAEAKTVCRSL
ncbi:hypothetical protein AK812_SmicGene27022 [Symbiodinium microadriaticum]|uniref:Uncharacterized protein n=1 Tax=Symbiodinium microadriaticum TaxID=2951 RepID=A0A1Q9D7V2_SYMMI|nr:hypothetical protein AK812_SmicGene27022 [Symbiodinium microadriaticum]